MSRKKTIEEFINEANDVHDGKYDYSLSVYRGRNEKMKIICPIHGDFWQTPNHHLHGNGCPKCAIYFRSWNNRLTTDKFIEKAKDLHGDDYDYSKVEYKTSKERVEIICRKCGETFYQKPNDHLNGKGCPYCNNSHLETQVMRMLVINDIDFEYQKKFDWLGKQSLDFYLPKCNIAIECQGKQHFGYGGWSAKFDFDKLKELDIRKYNLCKENNVKILYYSNVEVKDYIDVVFNDLNELKNRFFIE